MTLRIAAVVPLYNGSLFIEAALKSIVAQSRPADEIIVVDDGSKDNGPEIVQEFARLHPNVTLLRKSNGGQGSARNLGVRHSSCDLIALLDQDDWWYGYHLELLEKPFLEGNVFQLGYVYANLDEVDLHGRMMTHKMLNLVPNTPHPKTSVIDCLRTDMFILPGASLIARIAFEEAGCFDERLKGYEDDDLFLRIFLKGYRSVFIDEAVTAWRVHRGSTSYTTNMWHSRKIFFENLLELFPETNTHLVRDIAAPRLANSVYANMKEAMKRRDHSALKLAVNHFQYYTSFLPRGKRHRMRRRARWRLAKFFVWYKIEGLTGRPIKADIIPSEIGSVNG